MYIVYTLRGWRDNKWLGFATLLKIFKIDTNQINYIVPAIFYSPDQKKIIAFYVQKFPNAKSRNVATGFTYVDPGGPDTLYDAFALIGFRNDTQKIWHLYPLENEQVNGAPTLNEGVAVLYQYYFKAMKNHSMYKIIQSGEQKGKKELETYKYNIQDEGFWDKCWLWDKDTVGSPGLYNFQIHGYNYNGDKYTPDCATPYNPPIIDYPKEVLKLYK